MFSRETAKLVTFSFAVFFVGLFLGNWIILGMSLIPLFTVLLGLQYGKPGKVEIRQVERAIPAWVGQTRALSFDVVTAGGAGAIAVAQQLPANFEVLEGNNFGLFWKGRGERRFSLTCEVRCTKRGSYSMPPVQWEAQHSLDLLPPTRGESGSRAYMSVSPRILDVRRIRGIPSVAHNPFPELDVAKVGLPTTDFREIRKYVYGDPIKTINWKATARQERRGISWPLVNEYEPEGKKTVWVFLDGSSYMMVGTATENVLEYAVEAASAVALYYLDRGYRVGMYVYNGVDKLFYPDSGRKQYFRFSRELIGLKPAQVFDQLPQAIQRCRSYILGYNPLCVVITRLDTRYAHQVEEGVKKILALRSGWRRRVLPVMVVSIAGYDTVAPEGPYEQSAGHLLRLGTRPAVDSLHRLGASVLEWNPRKEGFATALLRQVRTG